MDSIEDFVDKRTPRSSPLPQHQQQIIISNEIEPWKQVSLLFQVFHQGRMTKSEILQYLFQLTLDIRQLQNSNHSLIILFYKDIIKKGAFNNIKVLGCGLKES